MKPSLKNALFYLIIGILLFAIYGSLDLSIKHYNLKDICPKLLGIPACYLVFVFFMSGLISHVFLKNKMSKFLFSLPIGLTFMMALNGTLTELSGVIGCPITSGGTPMCFISLGICLGLIVLKAAELRIVKSHSI